MHHTPRVLAAAKSTLKQCLLPLFIFIPIYSSAQIYKWVDESGNTHFGNRPQGEAAEEIELRNKPAIDSELDKRRQKQQRLLEVFEEERQEKKEKKAARKEEEKKHKANCAKAQQNHQEIREASFLYNDTDDPNNPEILSSEARQKETSKAQAEVKRWCK